MDEKEEVRQIQLDNNRIISSFRNIHHRYEFVGKNFLIQQEGIGELFIDTQTFPDRVLVFALTASAKISLQSSDGSESYSDIFLTPHMYLEFDPSK